ncbi:hypothetical protein, conserved [Plasmodium gonderi]|uniref:Uncharacterized protein n=1 Tax=Plasmodium gonderi TaxID=77519 RepID=A0A1Y1JGT7_PLAGO|nr:hypothetical protein, conserved [Plasmodium gonderi]GAW80868.1 hypothetical protein, conserved [Plasmodium gonderi]
MNDVDIEEYNNNVIQELNAAEEEGEISLSLFLHDLIEIDIESNFSFNYKVINRVIHICINSLNSNLVMLGNECMHFIRYSINKCRNMREEINESFFENINIIVKICLNEKNFVNDKFLLFQRAFLSFIIELDNNLRNLTNIWKSYKTNLCTFYTCMLHLISYHLSLLNNILEKLKEKINLHNNKYIQIGCSRIKIIEVAFDLVLKIFQEICHISDVSPIIDYVNLIVDTYEHIPHVEIKKKILSLCRCLHMCISDKNRIHFPSLNSLINFLNKKKKNNYLAITKENDINISYLRNCSYIYVSDSHLYINTFRTHAHQNDDSMPPNDKIVLSSNGYKGSLLLNFFYAYFYNTQNKLLIVLSYDRVKMCKDSDTKMLIFCCSQRDALGVLSNKLRTQFDGHLLDQIEICIKFPSESVKDKMFDVIEEVISIESSEFNNNDEAIDESEDLYLREGDSHVNKFRSVVNDGKKCQNPGNWENIINCDNQEDENKGEEKSERRKVSFATMKEIYLMDDRTPMGTKTLLLEESLNEVGRNEHDVENDEEMDEEKDQKIDDKKDQKKDDKKDQKKDDENDEENNTNDRSYDLADQECKNILVDQENVEKCQPVQVEIFDQEMSTVWKQHIIDQDKKDSMSDAVQFVSTTNGMDDADGRDTKESRGGMRAKVSYVSTKDLVHADDRSSEAHVLTYGEMTTTIVEKDELFQDMPFSIKSIENKKNLRETDELANNDMEIDVFESNEKITQPTGHEAQLLYLLNQSVDKKTYEQVRILEKNENDGFGDANMGNKNEIKNVHKRIGTNFPSGKEVNLLLLSQVVTKSEVSKEEQGEQEQQHEEKKKTNDEVVGNYFSQSSYIHGYVPQHKNKKSKQSHVVNNVETTKFENVLHENGPHENVEQKKARANDASPMQPVDDLCKSASKNVCMKQKKSSAEIVKKLLNHDEKQKIIDEYIQSLSKPHMEDVAAHAEDIICNVSMHTEGERSNVTQGYIRRVSKRLKVKRERRNANNHKITSVADNTERNNIDWIGNHEEAVNANCNTKERDEQVENRTFVQVITSPGGEKTSIGKYQMYREDNKSMGGDYSSKIMNIEDRHDASNEMILSNDTGEGNTEEGEDDSDKSGRNSGDCKLVHESMYYIDKPCSNCKSKKRIATNVGNVENMTDLVGNEENSTSNGINNCTMKNNNIDSPYPIKKTKYHYHDPKFLNMLKNEENFDNLSAKYLIKAYTLIQYNKRYIHIQIADYFRCVRNEIITSYEQVNNKYVNLLKQLQLEFDIRIQKITSRHSNVLITYKNGTGQINGSVLPIPIDLQIISEKVKSLHDTLNIVQRTMHHKIINLQIVMKYKESDVYTPSLSLGTLMSRCSTERP